MNEKDDSYSFFHCPSCGYRADRDYVGAVNVGRRFLLELEADGNGKKGCLRLEKAKTAAYRAAVGSPADRSRRGTHEDSVAKFDNLYLFLSSISITTNAIRQKLSLVNYGDG